MIRRGAAVFLFVIFCALQSSLICYSWDDYDGVIPSVIENTGQKNYTAQKPVETGTTVADVLSAPFVFVWDGLRNLLVQVGDALGFLGPSLDSQKTRDIITIDRAFDIAREDDPNTFASAVGTIRGFLDSDNKTVQLYAAVYLVNVLAEKNLLAGDPDFEKIYGLVSEKLKQDGSSNGSGMSVAKGNIFLALASNLEKPGYVQKIKSFGYFPSSSILSEYKVQILFALSKIKFPESEDTILQEVLCKKIFGGAILKTSSMSADQLAGYAGFLTKEAKNIVELSYAVKKLESSEDDTRIVGAIREFLDNNNEKVRCYAAVALANILGDKGLLSSDADFLKIYNLVRDTRKQYADVPGLERAQKNIFFVLAGDYKSSESLARISVFGYFPPKYELVGYDIEMLCALSGVKVYSNEGRVNLQNATSEKILAGIFSYKICVSSEYLRELFVKYGSSLSDETKDIIKLVCAIKDSGTDSKSVETIRGFLSSSNSKVQVYAAIALANILQNKRMLRADRDFSRICRLVESNSTYPVETYHGMAEAKRSISKAMDPDDRYIVITEK